MQSGQQRAAQLEKAIEVGAGQQTINALLLEAVRDGAQGDRSELGLSTDEFCLLYPIRTAHEAFLFVLQHPTSPRVAAVQEKFGITPGDVRVAEARLRTLVALPTKDLLPALVAADELVFYLATRIEPRAYDVALARAPFLTRAQLVWLTCPPTAFPSSPL